MQAQGYRVLVVRVAVSWFVPDRRVEKALTC